MIEVKNISKSFEGKTVLDDISCVFESGKVNLIIGQSGMGKTVLMKCTVGLFEVDSGAVFFDGRNFSAMDFRERKPVRQEIGMVFQGGALFDSLTVEQNVMFPLNMFTTMSSSEKIDRVNFCLRRVNLENANKKFPSEISGGMKKRVAIARAIAMNPRYLFCDEPNSGLDPKTSIVIDELIREITDEFKTTTVVNTHDMNSLTQIGEHIVFIYKGRKWWEGSYDEIRNAENKELNDFVFASKIMQRMRE
jgi:phospholipid/cholesterol/gamma-HCH transport system ATP-binding protein